MKILLVCIVSALWVLIVMPAPGIGQEESLSPAVQYYDAVESGLAHCQKQLPAITTSAEKAAKLFVAGGNIYADGSQEQFKIEAVNRAGGLMTLKQLPNKQGQTPTIGDLVLYGVRGKVTRDDLKKIGQWRAAGAYVVAFAKKGLLKRSKTGPNAIIDCGKTPGLMTQAGGERKLVPVDTVINTINLWVWTGEFASACTRLGKMPVFYQSYSTPGGRERAKKQSGKKFHDDFKIKPVKAGLLGKAYLDNISKYLAQVRRNELGKLRKAAKWLRETESKEFAATLPIGHLFPGHFQDPRAPQISAFHPHNIYQKQKSIFSQKHFVFYCGYQYPPEELIELALEKKFKLLYVTVERSAKEKQSNNIIYIDPAWPLSDGCVSVPGYDVPILPASGVVNATIYWALLSESLGN